MAVWMQSLTRLCVWYKYWERNFQYLEHVFTRKPFVNQLLGEVVSIFLEHCFLGDKLYSNPEGGTMIDDEERPLKSVLCAAERYYTSERQKVDAFIKSADQLIEDKQFGIAAFNLHQAFELTFRFMEHLCLGESRVTHSIISHIKYCKPFFPNTISLQTLKTPIIVNFLF